MVFPLWWTEQIRQELLQEEAGCCDIPPHSSPQSSLWHASLAQLLCKAHISRHGNTKQHRVPTLLQELQHTDSSMDGILERDGSSLYKPEVLSRMSSLDRHIMKKVFLLLLISSTQGAERSIQTRHKQFQASSSSHCWYPPPSSSGMALCVLESCPGLGWDSF